MDADRSVALPIEWKFALDTADKGEGLGYWKTDFDDSKWGKARTDRLLENQGCQKGWLHAWFRLDTTIPERFRGSRKTIFHFEERNMKNELTKRHPVELGKSAEFRQISSDVNVNGETTRLELTMESDMPQGETAEVRKASFDQIPLLTH